MNTQKRTNNITTIILYLQEVAADEIMYYLKNAIKYDRDQAIPHLEGVLKHLQALPYNRAAILIP